MNMNPRKHIPRRPRSRPATAEAADNASYDSASTTAKIIKEHDDQATEPKTVSFLPPETIRWMTKRKKFASNSVVGQILPSKAYQLRQVFKSLDFDDSGTIDIKELKHAVKYVNQSSTAGRSNGLQGLIRDPQGLTDFFISMDKNKDGQVDFREFLLSMSTEVNESKQVDSAVDQQEEFFDFATKHRRHKILEFVRDPSNPDMKKYEELKQLFRMKYFTMDKVDLTVSDKLNRAKSELKNRIKEINSDAVIQQKKKELIRAREASLFFTNNRKKLEQLNQLSQQQLVHVNREHLSSMHLEDTQTDKNIRKRFSQFSLHDHHTYTPGMETVARTSNSTFVHRSAKDKIQQIRNEKYLVSKLPPILPPITIKERIASLPPASSKH